MVKYVELCNSQDDFCSATGPFGLRNLIKCLELHALNLEMPFTITKSCTSQYLLILIIMGIFVYVCCRQKFICTLLLEH